MQTSTHIHLFTLSHRHTFASCNPSHSLKRSFSQGSHIDSTCVQAHSYTPFHTHVYTIQYTQSHTYTPRQLHIRAPPHICCFTHLHDYTQHSHTHALKYIPARIQTIVHAPSHTRCVLPISHPCRGPRCRPSQQDSGESRADALSTCPAHALTAPPPGLRPRAQELLQAPVHRPLGDVPLFVPCPRCLMATAGTWSSMSGGVPSVSFTHASSEPGIAGVPGTFGE